MITELALAPLVIVGGRSHGMAHRDRLDAGIREEIEHHTQTLRANPDERDIDPAVGRDPSSRA